MDGIHKDHPVHPRTFSAGVCHHLSICVPMEHSILDRTGQLAAAGRKLINPVSQSWATGASVRQLQNCYNQSFFLLQPWSNENIITSLAANLCLQQPFTPAVFLGQQRQHLRQDSLSALWDITDWPRSVRLVTSATAGLISYQIPNNHSSVLRLA